MKHATSNTAKRMAAPWLRVGGLVALLALAGCDQMIPTVAVQSMVVQRLSPDLAEYVALCQVTNPNGHDMHVEQVRWRLSSGDRKVVEGEFAKAIELPANKVTALPIYFQLTRAQLNDAALSQAGRFDYRFAGQVRFASPLGAMKTDFASAGQMPVIRPLGVELKGVEVIGLTETRVGVALDVEVTNDNDILLFASMLTGELVVNERPLVVVEADLGDEVSIPPRGASRLRIPLWVSSPEVGVRTLSRMLTTPDTEVRLVGKMVWRIPGVADVNDLLSARPARAVDNAPAAASGEGATAEAD